MRFIFKTDYDQDIRLAKHGGHIFWYGLLWAVIGAITAVFLVGFAVLFANFVWIIYRIVKGWLNLSDGKPMPA